MTAYAFERPFRLKILALMLDNRWMASYGDELILPSYFEREDEEAIAQGILDYRKAFHKSPVDPYDLVTITNPIHTNIIHKIFETHEAGELEYVSHNVIEFAREQAVKLAILDSIDEVNAGKLEAPIERLRQALDVGNNITSPGLDPIRDSDKWLYEYWSDKVRTGLTHVDIVLEGGLGVPELGIIMAPPGGGKSTTLVNVGFGAAGILSGKNVAHFTHEMKVEQVCKRYAARMTFRFPQRGDNLSLYDQELQKAGRKLMPGQVRVIGGGKFNIESIRSSCNRLQNEGFDLGVIIDDYPDLLAPSRKYSERRFELSSIYEELRGLSEEFGVPVWGATQARREALSKEIITMGDIAEDIGKAAISDVIIAVCQTWEEKQVDQCRLFMAKIRDAESKHNLIQCKYFPKSMAIITTGFINKSEGDKDA